MKVGDVVSAKGQITEEIEGGAVVHAEPGERGRVVDVFPDDWLMIAWSNAAAHCHADELTPLEAAE